MDYGHFHRDRLNLWLHLLVVPLFISGVLLSFGALLTLRLSLLLAGLGLAAFSLFVQGRGHAREQVPALPFRGLGDFLWRIFREQFVLFPRFVWSGGWRRQLSGATVTTQPLPGTARQR